jgi:hypothetical protein
MIGACIYPGSRKSGMPAKRLFLGLGLCRYAGLRDTNEDLFGAHGGDMCILGIG